MGLYDKTIGAHQVTRVRSLLTWLIGTLLMGIFFNTYLYGLVTYQFAAYYQIRFNDPPITRYIVLFLFILDTVHSASAIYLAWNYIVVDYDDPAALAVANLPHALTPLATALAALVTQLYLGFRIWRLTRSKVLYGTVIVLAIPSFIFGTVTSIKAWTIKIFAEFPRFTVPAAAWLSTQMAVDVFITITLVIVFSRSRTGFRKTDTILNRFTRGAIQTGLFAGLFSICDLITFVTLPDLGLYGMFAIPIGRIYTNTFLDVLLTRGLLQEATDGEGNMNVVTDSVYLPPTGPQAEGKVAALGA